jgi:hypothetical protein
VIEEESVGRSHNLTATMTDVNVCSAPVLAHADGATVASRDDLVLEDLAPGRAARQEAHLGRVRRHARELLPEVGGRVGLETEEGIVNLMYGDVDEFRGILQGSVVGPEGAYAVTVPISFSFGLYRVC